MFYNAYINFIHIVICWYVIIKFVILKILQNVFSFVWSFVLINVLAFKVENDPVNTFW